MYVLAFVIDCGQRHLKEFDTELAYLNAKDQFEQWARGQKRQGKISEYYYWRYK